MGLAISGMHYAAMEGASFVPANTMAGHAGHFVGRAPLAFLLAGATITGTLTVRDCAAATAFPNTISIA